MPEAVATPAVSLSLFRRRLEALRLQPRNAAKLMGLGENGERSMRRMLKGEKPIPDRFWNVLDEAEKGLWPAHFRPGDTIGATIGGG